MNTKVKSFCTSLAICCVLALLVALPQIADGTSAIEYDKNENGFTYGPFLGGVTETVYDNPDLIEAIATNGKEGYIYKSDYERASLEQERELSDKEFEERIESQTELLRETFNDYMGSEILSSDEAFHCLTLSISGELDEVCDFVGEIIEEEFVEAIRADALVKTDLLEIDKSGIIDLYLYERDTDAKSEVSAKELANLDEATIKELVVDETIGLEIVLDEDVFHQIYEQAERQTAIYIPVYEKDGKTVIGEFAFYIM